MRVRAVEPQDHAAWLLMRIALWPETERQRQRQEMAMMLSDAGRYAVFVCETPDGELIGFAEASLREWAEGCLSSPVAYLEGWYVAPDFRRRGAGRALLSACEAWARSRGCSEIASDTGIDNRVSEAAHLSMGFEVAGRVLALRKNL
jgi:aminoglycoside 6'-N-acetyltransferase I